MIFTTGGMSSVENPIQGANPSTILFEFGSFFFGKRAERTLIAPLKGSSYKVVKVGRGYVFLDLLKNIKERNIISSFLWKESCHRCKKPVGENSFVLNLYKKNGVFCETCVSEFENIPGALDEKAACHLLKSDEAFHLIVSHSISNGDYFQKLKTCVISREVSTIGELTPKTAISLRFIKIPLDFFVYIFQTYDKIESVSSSLSSSEKDIIPYGIDCLSSEDLFEPKLSESFASELAKKAKNKIDGIFVFSAEKVVLNDENIFLCPFIKADEDAIFPPKSIVIKLKDKGLLEAIKEWSFFKVEAEEITLLNFAIGCFHVFQAKNFDSVVLDDQDGRYMTMLFENENDFVVPVEIQKLTLLNHAACLIKKISFEKQIGLLKIQGNASAIERMALENFSLKIDKVDGLLLEDETTCLLSRFQKTKPLDLLEINGKLDKSSVSFVKKGSIRFDGKLVLKNECLENANVFVVAENGRLDKLQLSSDKKEYVEKIPTNLFSTWTICPGSTRCVVLELYAVDLLHNISFSLMKTEKLVLKCTSYDQIQKTKNIIGMGVIPFYFLIEIKLYGYAVNLLPKIKVMKRRYIRLLELSAKSIYEVSDLLAYKEGDIFIGDIQEVKVSSEIGKIKGIVKRRSGAFGFLIGKYEKTPNTIEFINAGLKEKKEALYSKVSSITNIFLRPLKILFN
eukprot:GHVN01081945.1.p1 GENE.GHVN01081945.1~~GHVN01081945.1.p1  ORF type:complete len:682 (-),score=43.46 GHVN01081945.1:16-2061(-)